MIIRCADGGSFAWSPPERREFRWNSFKRRWIEWVPFEQSFGAQMARGFTQIDWSKSVQLRKRPVKGVIR
jgi:hypothetical protein